jgi:predicted dehydrogenase
MGVGFMTQLAAGRKIGPNDRINLAVIGVGGQGTLHFKYQTEGNKAVRVAALCDVDKKRLATAVKKVPGNHKVKTYDDYRKLLEDKDIHCVLVATPNHWHALQTVHACQAEKDVYVEKPATHCVSEGPKMIEAAKKYDRVVQVGTHKRANPGRREAMRLLREGLLGEVYQAEFNFFRARNSIGTKPNGPVPAGVNYDLWLGPAPKRPFNPNRFHYNWHWFWDYGGGELANNGPHYIDMIVEGLGRQDEFPEKVSCQGGRYVWNDQGETPNSATALYRYADGTRITLSVLDQISKNGQRAESDLITFRGEKGIMKLGMRGDFTTIVNNKPGPKHEAMKGTAHSRLAANFYDVVRSRKVEDLLSPPEYGHVVASVCHLGNIAYRCGQDLCIDPATQTILDNETASALLTRTYREPYVMPEVV